MYQDFFNKNDDYLSEFRQKVASQKIATVEERRMELARSRNNFLGTFAGIILAGIVGWFVFAPQYMEDGKQITVIRRPQSAVKIKPENSGGMEIPNQDKDVYNIVEKKNVDTTVVENLLPTPEKPKLPDIVPDVTDIDENAANLDEIVDEVSQDTTSSTANETLKAINKAPETDAGNVPQKPADLLKEPAKEASSQSSATDSKPKTSESEKPDASENTPLGNWQIQLIASKNKAAVEKAWNDLSAKYSQLKGYSHEIQTSDLGAQGIFYRLRAGAFASKEQAANACAQLKAKGLTDCIAKER